MDFHYREIFGEASIPEAYEQLLVNAMQGDATLFARNDEVDLAWKFIDGIRAGWSSATAAPLVSYSLQSWGPKESIDLLHYDNRQWVHDCGKHRQ